MALIVLVLHGFCFTIQAGFELGLSSLEFMPWKSLKPGVTRIRQRLCPFSDPLFRASGSEKGRSVCLIRAIPGYMFFHVINARDLNPSSRRIDCVAAMPCRGPCKRVQPAAELRQSSCCRLDPPAGTAACKSIVIPGQAELCRRLDALAGTAARQSFSF